MLVDHKRRFIFVHVPRTGGHSAYEMLGIKERSGLHYPRSHRPEQYFSFGFIRNPWDRMYSCYRKQSQILEKHKGKSFKYYLLEGIKGNIVEHQAMWYLAGCDYIGMYETLQVDWNILNPLLGFPVRELPKVNSCGDPDYRPHYDNEMVEHIAANHADDILLGGYRFE